MAATLAGLPLPQVCECRHRSGRAARQRVEHIDGHRRFATVSTQATLPGRFQIVSESPRVML